MSSSVLRHDLFHPSAIANFTLHSSPSSSSLHYCLCAIARTEPPAPPPSPQAFSQKLCRPLSTRESSVDRLLRRGAIMFGTAIRYMVGRKPKPKMKPIELKTPPEQTQTITRVIFDILKEHGPLSIADTWERVKEVGVRGLTSKRHMKIVLRWMRERQKLKLICNHVGPNKQFLYSTWFTKPDIKPTTLGRGTSQAKLP
nr:thiamine-phosphate synthase [Ipomoea batatas]